MIEPVHVGELIPEVMRDIERRIADRRHLEGLFDRIDQARTRIVEIHRELGPHVAEETRGVPQSREEASL